MEAPLLPHPSTTTSAPTLLGRMSTIIVLSLLSLYANYQASIGIDITVLPANPLTPAARQFNLLFVSNGHAFNLLYAATNFIEPTLFPDNTFPRKPLRRVSLQLATHHLLSAVSIAPSDTTDNFIITISPTIITDPAMVVAAVYEGVARAWLWDGQGAAPPGVLDAVVEYLVKLAGFRQGPMGGAAVEGRCWAAGGGGGEVVGYWEERRPGFVARLNSEMRGRWSEGMVEAALGLPARRACEVYRAAVGGAAGDTAELVLRQQV